MHYNGGQFYVVSVIHVLIGLGKALMRLATISYKGCINLIQNRDVDFNLLFPCLYIRGLCH